MTKQKADQESKKACAYLNAVDKLQEGGKPISGKEISLLVAGLGEDEEYLKKSDLEGLKTKKYIKTKYGGKIK